MRLLTWNACRGRFGNKVPLLDHLGADIAVIQEIASPGDDSDRALWFGDNLNQGIAVVAREPFSLRALEQLPNAPKYIIPVAVEGPISFVLFAVWTVYKQPMRYIRAVSTAIDMYSTIFAQNSVILLGDFNSNAIWDKDHPATLNHSSMVARLERHGLVSAYHHQRGEAQGHEKEPTFYLHWNELKPYHIDYCFLPRQWASEIQRVEIGSFAAWKDHSDHRPLIVDV
jgi:exonuclease III